MKFKITMKDPDGVHESLEQAAKKSVSETKGVTEDERESLVEHRREKLSDEIGKWFEYDEYVTIEIDTEAKTATVCERR